MNNSKDTVTSQAGIDGSINIDVTDDSFGGALVVLPSELVDVTMQLAEQCEARGGRTLASFVGTGRGGLPAGPEDPMPAHYQVGLGGSGFAKSAAKIEGGGDPHQIRFKTFARRMKKPGSSEQTSAVPGTMALSCRV